MPAKKTGKKKKEKKPKTVAGTNDTADVIVKRLMKCYEKNCAATSSQMSPGIRKAMKDCVENSTLLVKFIVESVPVEKEGDFPVLIEAFLASIRQERYTHIKDLHVWDYPLAYENIATLALLMEKSVYPLRIIELMDCLIQPYAVERLSRTFKLSESLTTVNLDYNEFGDEGCKYLCHGVEGNTKIISVSMCYCGLGAESGKILGHIAATTAVRELYLDGNDLECAGAVELIKMCVDQAEVEAREREEEKKKKEEEEAQKAEKRSVRTPVSTTQSDKEEDVINLTVDKKKKKGKKKKKKKEPPPPPPVGPWIYKLHIADNGLDSKGESENLSPITCMRLFKKLLMHSKCFEELDIEDNLIGDLAAREIMAGLEFRKEEKLPGVKVRTTHRINTDTFNSIIKLGAGGLKKKKKKGKKKKK